LQWIITDYPTQKVNVGDAVRFTYAPFHNVYLHPRGSCDEAGSTLVGAEDDSPVTFVFDQAGTYTFACQIPGHCAQGQIVTFVVQDNDEEKSGEVMVLIPDPQVQEDIEDLVNEFKTIVTSFFG